MKIFQNMPIWTVPQQMLRLLSQSLKSHLKVCIRVTKTLNTTADRGTRCGKFSKASQTKNKTYYKCFGDGAVNQKKYCDVSCPIGWFRIISHTLRCGAVRCSFNVLQLVDRPSLFTKYCTVFIYLIIKGQRLRKSGKARKG